MSSIDRLLTYAADHDISYYQAIKEVDFTGVTKRAAIALSEFDTLLRGFIKQQEFLSATDMVDLVLKKKGYEKMLKSEQTLEGQRRVENREEFMTPTQELEAKSEGEQARG